MLESAVRRYEDVLGIRHPGISTLSKKAEKLLSHLEPEQREEVCCNNGRDVCDMFPDERLQFSQMGWLGPTTSKSLTD